MMMTMISLFFSPPICFPYLLSSLIGSLLLSLLHFPAPHTVITYISAINDYRAAENNEFTDNSEHIFIDLPVRMANNRSPLDSLFFWETGATDRNWKALSGVGRIDPVVGGGAKCVTGGGGPGGGGGGGGGAGPSTAAAGGGCGMLGGGGGKNAVFLSKSPTEYRVPKICNTRTSTSN